MMNTLRNRQRGLSIVELMVSVAISVAVLSALSYVYVGSRGAYRTNEALARVQETGRFALEWISRDLRQAGFMGCLSRGANTTFYSNPKPPSLLPPGVAIFGHEDGAGFIRTGLNPPNPTTINHVRGDVVRLLSLDFGVRALVTEDTDVVNANIKIDSNPGFVQGEFLIVTDCERAAVFTLTPGGQSNTLAHAANVNGGLDTPNHRINPPYQKQSRAFVARFGSVPVGYFIGKRGNIASARPSLYRFGPADSGLGVKTEEVVENVEDLDFLFGIDANADGAIDAYWRASDLYFTDPALTQAERDARWSTVLSVRVSLVAVSSESFVIPSEQPVYLRDTSGDTVVDVAAARRDNPGVPDPRLRQVFSTTVALRNRLP